MRFHCLCLFIAATHGCDQTRCTDATMQGTFADDTFQPTSGCYYGVPTPAETFELLRGSWLLATGGSNAWKTFQALANQLEPFIEAYSPDKGTSSPRWTDIIWQKHPINDSYTLQHYRWLNVSGLAALDAPVHEAFELPAWSANHVRITYAHGCERPTEAATRH